MVDSRKRPLEETGIDNVSKKRAVSLGSDSPVVMNGKTDIAPEDINAANLETFRKQAVYRRMKYYFREHERAQERIIELEKRRDFLQANVTAIIACWEQLIREMKLIVGDSFSKGEDLQLFEIVSKPKFGDSSTFLNDLLRNHGIATERLVSGVISINPRIDKNGLMNRCTDLEQEVVNLRAEIFIANNRISEVDGEKERYYSRLLDVEARLDRLETSSFTVLTQNGSPPVGAIENNDHVVKKEEEEEEEGSATLSVQTLKTQDVSTNDYNLSNRQNEIDWRKLYESCVRHNEEITEELVQLRNKCSEFSLELAAPGQDTLKKSSIFENIINHMQTIRVDAEVYREKCNELSAQLEHFREAQEDFKEKTAADYNVRYEEQKNLIIKKETETSRLREQRDALQAEVNELRARGNERKSTAQFETLLQARADRMAALESEVKRLKSQLAANTGNEYLLELILGDKLADLPDTLRSAQHRLEALESTLSTLDLKNPEISRHLRSESETREALANALSRLKRYESLYGPPSTFPPDQQTLLKRLTEKDESLRRVELQLTQEKAASNELFAEIERLSAAWEALDRQNKSKIFDMDAMEVKLQKLSVEKAKADNKYFAAMRQKEAAEAERKAAARALEKSQKTVDRFTEAEKLVSTKLIHQEKEILAYQKRVESTDDKVTTLERQNSTLIRQDEDHCKSIVELKRQLTDAHTREKKYKLDVRHFEEECIKLRKSVEYLDMKISSMPIADPSSREAELEERVEKCMKILRCSTCKQNLRSHVLTKCMHTFCKDCVQARIDTRQRKCPACNMGFTQGEFQALYFQG